MSSDEIGATIRRSAVGIGADVLGADLLALDALDIDVEDGSVTVALTLPIAHRATRERIVRQLRALDVPFDYNVELRPRAADPGEWVDLIPDVKNVVAVSSGKGGVGKSTVAANVAVALADAGADVGLLDGDVYGPNAPALLGLSSNTPATTTGDRIVPRRIHGVRVMSMDFVVGEDDPVIWRGPIVDDLLTQFFGDVSWGSLDYLVVDLPPGTGDAQLTLVQHFPVAGAIIVTTPQPVAVDDARRGLAQFRRYDVPILGVVENMAGFECRSCGSSHDLFDEGGGAELAGAFDVPLLGRIELDPAVGILQEEPADPSGVTLPGVGRIQLPRTRRERESSGRLPPTAVRDDGGATRDAFRAVATQLAARVNERAVRSRSS